MRINDNRRLNRRDLFKNRERTSGGIRDSDEFDSSGLK